MSKDKKQPVVKQIAELAKRITAIEEALKSPRLVFPKLSKAEPLAQFKEVKVEMGPADPVYTANGVMVGSNAWCAYVGDSEQDPTRVLLVKVTGLDRRTEELMVDYVDDASDGTQPFDMVFPHSDAGKRAAEHALKDVLREERGKEARRAQLLVYAFEGELTVKALEALGNRSLMSLAGIVGLSAFKHLKGLQGKDRTKAVIEGVKKFRKTTNSPETLKAAKALVKAWETEVKATNAEEIANAKSVSEKVTAMRKQDEAVNGRSLTDGSIPTGPKTGDLIVDADSFWYRIVGVGAIKGLFLAEHMSKKEIRKTFSGLKFQRLSSRKNTPVWSGGVGGAAPK